MPEPCSPSQWEVFDAAAKKELSKGGTSAEWVASHFPFVDFFADAPQPLFKTRAMVEDYAIAQGCWGHIQALFKELDECRAFELLRSTYDRGNFLLSKHAKVIAMTYIFTHFPHMSHPILPIYQKLIRVF